MRQYILEAMNYFTVEQWTNLDGIQQLKYGQVVYIYMACQHLGISVVTPDFMRIKIRTDKFNKSHPIKQISVPKAKFKCKFCSILYYSKEIRDEHVKICRKRFSIIKEKEHYLANQPPQSISSPTNKPVFIKRIVQPGLLKEISKQATIITPIIKPKPEVPGEVKKRKRTTHKPLKWAIYLGPKKAYKCGKCEYKSHDFDIMQEHRKSHGKRDKIACKACDKTFSSKHYLLFHVKSAHSNEDKAFLCDECGYSSHGKYQLKMHKLNMHSDVKLFICEFCGKGFNLKLQLKHHSYSHTNEDKPYKCSDCEKSFLTPAILTQHMNAVHLNIRQFGCDVCPYVGVSKSALSMHVKIHSDVKNFKCKFCAYRCRTNTNLKKHTDRIHGK